MSETNGRCDICYKKLQVMAPEVYARQVEASKKRGDWEPDPSKRVTICDPCWQRAIRRGWNPASNKAN